MVSTGVVAKINIETMGREDVEATHRAIAEDDLSVVEINTARKKAECWVKSGEGYDLGRSVGSSIGHKRITVEDSQARSKSVGCSGNDAGARADSGPMGGPRIES